MPSMRKIILATVGSMGDLHPLIAIARALKARGFRPVLAVPEDHVAKSLAAGIEAVAVLPGFATLCSRMGLDEAATARRLIGDQRQILEQVILPDLASCTARLEALAADAEAIVASGFFLAAPIVAEKLGLPLVSVVLQPTAMLSPLDPPNTPDFWMMKHAPLGPVGRQWNRAMFGTWRRLIDLVYGRQIDRVRRAHGLAPTGGARMFEAKGAVLTLGCYSPLFAPLPEEAPFNTVLVGFPMFDAATDGGESLDPALEAFLAAGPAPLIFTLGTFAVMAPDRFYETAAAIARRLGVRAVLLTGSGATAQVEDGVFACAYAPHSRLFPRAAAIVHHGGAGTTGQALRAGKPQLVVPHMGDQYDHAFRIKRLGVGRRIAPRRFTLERVAPMLADILGDAAMQVRAADLGARISVESGAMVAAAVIERTLDAGHRAVPRSEPVLLSA